MIYMHPSRCGNLCVGRQRLARVLRTRCSAPEDGGAAAPQPLSTGTVVRTPNTEIRWGSYVSSLPVLELACKDACDSIMSSIGTDAQPQLAIVFATSDLGEDFDKVVPMLREMLPSLKHVVGCSGYGVIGGGPNGPIEVEGEPAFSLTLGQLPGVEMKVVHTLRSGVPDADASRSDWSEFIGVPYDTQKEVNFVIFSDPRFTQIDTIVSGLDTTYPDSKKIGGVLSTANRPRARALFAWSADQEKASSRRGSGGGRKGSSQRERRQAAMRAASRNGSASAGGASQPKASESETRKEVASVPTIPTQPAADGSGAVCASGGKAGGGIFGSLLRMLTGNKSEASAPAAKSKGGFAAPMSISNKDSSAEATSSSSSTNSGMYLHGAVILAIHGDVIMDTVTSLGFRSPSNRLYRVESLNRFNEIVTVTPEAVEGMSPPLDPTPSPPLASPPQIRVVKIGGMMGSDDDSDDEHDELGSEVLAIQAIVDMLEGLDDIDSVRNLEELLDSAMLAVAQDSGKASADLTPEDFELMPLEAMDEDNGMLVAAGRLRKGDRFKIMIRDDRGVREELREKILAYKRKDLQAMLTGAEPRPTFGVVMFTDMDRGEELYGEEHYESRTLSTYLPVPLSGLFGGGQIAPFNEEHRVVENACVAGIFRASLPRQPRSALKPPPADQSDESTPS